MKKTVRNKRGIKVKRCCASCRHKEIDEDGVRHCTKGFDGHETCMRWRMTKALSNCGTPFGVIKAKAYLRYVLDIRDREMNSSCFVNWAQLCNIKDIRKEYLINHNDIRTDF